LNLELGVFDIPSQLNAVKSRFISSGPFGIYRDWPLDFSRRTGARGLVDG